MYGPLPNPDRRLAPVEVFDVPEVYVACIAMGLGLSAVGWLASLNSNLKAALFIFGQVLVLTAPLPLILDDYAYGAVDPSACSLPIWVAGLSSASGASERVILNLWSLFVPIAAWFGALGVARGLGASTRSALVFTFPFAMGLHLFRDLNWADPADAAVFLIPAFAVSALIAVHRATVWRLVPLGVWITAGWISPPMASVILVLVLVVLALGHALTFRPAIDLDSVLLPVAVVGISAALLMSSWGNMPPLMISTSPLDRLVLGPIKWSGLEWHRSLNVVVVLAFTWAIWRWRKHRAAWFAFAFAASFTALATGLGLDQFPFGIGFPGTPFRPALFLHVAWCSMCVISAVFSTRSKWSPRTLAFVYLVSAGAWLIMVRSHPAYPPIYVF